MELRNAATPRIVYLFDRLVRSPFDIDPMRRFRTVLLAGLLVALPLHTGGKADAAMHLRLVKSDPAAAAAVASPTQLRLWFSLKPTLSLTTVKLTNASKVPVKLHRDVTAHVTVKVVAQ